MKSVIDISEQQLNEIKNSSSIEFLKSLILDNIKNNQDESSKESLILRTLSLNEYYKYIVNGTCNGSITANDKNTWHNFLTLNSTVSHSVGYGSTQCGVYNNICEILADNINNTYLRLLGNTWTITVTNPYAGMKRTATYNNTEYWTKSEYYRHQNIECFSYYTVITYVCFRPVFSYTDNKKSNNMFF